MDNEDCMRDPSRLTRRTLLKNAVLSLPEAHTLREPFVDGLYASDAA